MHCPNVGAASAHLDKETPKHFSAGALPGDLAEEQGSWSEESGKAPRRCCDQVCAEAGRVQFWRKEGEWRPQCRKRDKSVGQDIREPVILIVSLRVLPRFGVHWFLQSNSKSLWFQE